jgi:hypothetical protein
MIIKRDVLLLKGDKIKRAPVLDDNDNNDVKGDNSV